MKKLLLTIVLPAFLCACSNELTEELEPIGQPQASNVISVEEAIAIAIEYSQGYPQEATSRSAVVRTADPKNVVVKKNLSRSGSEPSYYIVNFDDAQGYAVVPAVNIGEPILGFVPEGTYTTASNPALEEYLAMAEEYIEQQSSIIIEKPDPGVGPVDPIPVDYLIESIKVDTNWYYHLEPRMPQEWGQNDIYGQYCPNNTCGCGPLSIALLTVWTNFKSGIEKSRLNYDFEERDIDSEEVTWAELFKHRWNTTFHTVGNKTESREHLCYTQDQVNVHKSIGRLCRQIGKDAHAEYQFSPRATGVKTSDIVPMLKKYVAKSYTVSSLNSYDYEHVNNYIDRGLLLILGFNSAAGHAWIGDGYHIESITTTRIFSYKDHSKPPYVDAQWTISRCEIHMRWGWNGDGDGYFSGNVLKTMYGEFGNAKFIAVYNK